MPKEHAYIVQRSRPLHTLRQLQTDDRGAQRTCSILSSSSFFFTSRRFCSSPMFFSRVAQCALKLCSFSSCDVTSLPTLEISSRSRFSCCEETQTQTTSHHLNSSSLNAKIYSKQGKQIFENMEILYKQ